MESSESRPPLLLPLVPHLPGDGARGWAAPLEPCLLPHEYGEAPPPIPCQPLPPELQQEVAAGGGMVLAARAHRSHSELAWCLVQRSMAARAEQQRQQATQATAVAEEPPAAAFAAPLPASTSSSSRDGGDGLGGSEGAVSSGPAQMHSRASAILQEQPSPPPPPYGEESAPPPPPGWPTGQQGIQAAVQEQGRAAGAAPASGKGLAAAGTAAAALPGGLAKAGRPPAAGSVPAQRQAAAARGAAQRRRAAQPKQPAQAAIDTAVDDASASSDSAGGARSIESSDEDAAREQLGMEAQAGGGAAATTAGAQAGVASPKAASKRARPPAQEAATEAALKQIGEPSWEEFCGKLLMAAEQREAAAEASGRGRGRKGGRGRGRGRGQSGAAAAEVKLADVLNQNSRMHHAAFAAAYRAAKEKLERRDVKRQKQEALKGHSQLVGRWSELTEQEHAWYLQHQGRPLAGLEAKRLELLRGRVEEEQRAYMAHVQHKASGASARYLHCTERQGAQLGDDAALRRQRVRQSLPRSYRLRAVLRVPWPAEAQPPALPLRHVATLRRRGAPPVFAPPPDGAGIPGDRIYLPCTVEAGSAGPGGGTGGASQVYRKTKVPPLAEDPLLPELVLQAQQQHHLSIEQQQERQQAPDAQPVEQRQQGEGAAPAAPRRQPVFCLAASALAAIVSTAMLERRPGWEIPITIQPATAAAAEPGGEPPGVQEEHGSVDEGSGGLVVCVEKPLLQRVETLRAKQERLHKYALLSLGLQQPGQQQQPEEEEEQQGQPPGQEAQAAAPRTRSSARAGPAAAGSGVATTPPAAAAQGSGLPPRGTAYDCWQLEGCCLVVRSHGVLLLQGQQRQQEQAGEEGGQGGRVAPGQAVLVVTSEYLPETDLEEATPDELCRWWLSLLLRPSAESVLVSHVHVPKARLLCCEQLTAADLEQRLQGGDGDREAPGREASPRMRQLAVAGLAFLRQLLGVLGEQSAGSYLLTHAPMEPAACLFRALPELAAAMPEEEAPLLPRGASLAQQGTVYSLHAAHQRSGATDLEADPFKPPRWRPFRPDVPQIRYTFPPKVGKGQLRGRQYAKARQRKAVPHAWLTLGQGGDFDQASSTVVGHAVQISKADYMQGLEEELT